MKKVMYLGLLAAVMLTGCGSTDAVSESQSDVAGMETTQTEDSAVETTAADLEKLPQEIKDVLLDNASFYDVGEKKEFTLADYQITTGEDGARSAVELGRYRVIDLDQDGKAELSVELSVPDSSVILDMDMRIFTCRDGAVSAYPTWTRETHFCYENGVVVGSGGANVHDYFYIHFAEDGLETEDIMRTDIENNPTQEQIDAALHGKGGPTAYYIGEKKVDKDAFNRYFQEYMNGAREVLYSAETLEDAIK